VSAMDVIPNATLLAAFNHVNTRLGQAPIPDGQILSPTQVNELIALVKAISSRRLWCHEGPILRPVVRRRSLS
jgi:hypothetical protein